MRPEAPWPELRAHIGTRLIPLADYDPVALSTRSPLDLDPRGRPAPAVLHPAAVLVPIVEHPAGPTVLLTRRSEDMMRHAGQVAFPGGRSDPGETPWDTALREAREEIGLDPACVELAGLSSPYDTVTGFRITPVVGFVRPDFALTLNAAEVAEAFEVVFARLIAPESYEERWLEAAGARRRFYAMPHEDRLIWGATAGMLHVLHDRLFGDAA